MANILRNLIGSIATVTGASAVANLAHSASADKLTIDNSANLALLADFELVATFATAPVAGSVQLIAMDWSLDGTVAPATPSTSVSGRYIGTFSPCPSTGNALTSWMMRLSQVALTGKADYYIYNNGTAYALNSGWILKAQSWSPGA